MATTQLSRAAYERLQDESTIHHARANRGGPEDRGRSPARRPQRERRLPRSQGRAGPHGGPHPPAGTPPRDSEIIEGGGDGSVAAGSIVTIVYEGDSRDDAERYLIGHMEEKTGDLDVVSPSSPLGAALLGSRPGDTVEFEAPNGKLRVEVIEVEGS